MNGASVATPHGRVMLVPDEARKMELLRVAAGDPSVTNIEIAAPTLDDLYAHFLYAGECRVRNIVIIAGKEIQEGLRNRWVLATTLLLAALALSLTFLGSAPTGNVGAGALDVVVVSLSSLTIFLLPLIALLISHDAVVGEMERGTMILLLSYPVGRCQVILGKFCGHVLILAFATVIGYGAAAAALAITGASVLAASWYAFASMLGTSIMLGAVFVAIGYLISSLVRDRGTAAGISVGIWLLMVLVFDMALLGILVVDQGQIVSAPVLEGAAVSQSDRPVPADQSDRVQRQPVFRHGRACRHRDAPASARCCWDCWSGSPRRSGLRPRSLRGGSYDPADRLRVRRRHLPRRLQSGCGAIRSRRRRSRSTATRWACSAA